MMEEEGQYCILGLSEPGFKVRRLDPMRPILYGIGANASALSRIQEPWLANERGSRGVAKH